MNFIYNSGIHAYRLAVRMASLKNTKAKRMLEGQATTFDYLRERLQPGEQYIWIHASSLGEFEQGRPLIEMIRERQPQARIVLSFFSPSGYEVRKNYDKVDAVCYLPFDLPSNVKTFLDLVKPKMAIFVKYEFWGNYLMELKHRDIPTYIVSAIFHPGQVFFKPWGKMFRKMLECYTTIFVQNEASRKLLKSVGRNNVEVAGDTRFDRVATVSQANRSFPVIERFVEQARFTLVMGSSWPDDEDIVFEYINAHPDVKLIVAPHEFDRDRLLDMQQRLKRPSGLYSTTAAEKAAQLDCLIIDSFGMLSTIYRYGQVAYVGGGFGNGIHNIIEAAVYGMPVIFGPNNERFREASDLMACGAGFCVTSAPEFHEVMDRLTSDTAQLKRCGSTASNYIQSQLGATKRIYDGIFRK